MENDITIETALLRAIDREEESATLYSTAAAAAKSGDVRKRLLELADQEKGHKARLEYLQAGSRGGSLRWAVRRSQMERIRDVRLSDHLEAKPLAPDADFQDVLLVAAQREKTAYNFYTAMVEMVDDQALKDVFGMLAKEEMRHKYDIEKIYDEVIYQAN